MIVLWYSSEVYIFINFKAREISRGARKFIRTPMLIKKNNNNFLLRTALNIHQYYNHIKDLL